jgi:hypothetical protein
MTWHPPACCRADSVTLQFVAAHGAFLHKLDLSTAALLRALRHFLPSEVEAILTGGQQLLLLACSHAWLCLLCAAVCCCVLLCAPHDCVWPAAPAVGRGCRRAVYGVEGGHGCCQW